MTDNCVLFLIIPDKISNVVLKIDLGYTNTELYAHTHKIGTVHILCYVIMLSLM